MPASASSFSVARINMTQQRRISTDLDMIRAKNKVKPPHFPLLAYMFTSLSTGVRSPLTACQGRLEPESFGFASRIYRTIKGGRGSSGILELTTTRSSSEREVPSALRCMEFPPSFAQMGSSSLKHIWLSSTLPSTLFLSSFCLPIFV